MVLWQGVPKQQPTQTEASALWQSLISSSVQTLGRVTMIYIFGFIFYRWESWDLAQKSWAPWLKSPSFLGTELDLPSGWPDFSHPPVSAASVVQADLKRNWHLNFVLVDDEFAGPLMGERGSRGKKSWPRGRSKLDESGVAWGLGVLTYLNVIYCTIEGTL
jgi:hypothetical protein